MLSFYSPCSNIERLSTSCLDLRSGNSANRFAPVIPKPRSLRARLWRWNFWPKFESVKLSHVGRWRWSWAFDITAVVCSAIHRLFVGIIKNHLSNLRGVAVVRRCRVEHSSVPQNHISLITKKLKGFNVGECVLETCLLLWPRLWPNKCGSTAFRMRRVQYRIAGQVYRVRLCFVE